MLTLPCMGYFYKKVMHICPPLLYGHRIKQSPCKHCMYRKQAGAELCQAQIKLEVEVEFGVEVQACH